MSSCFVLTIFFFGIGLCFASQLTDPGHTSFGALIGTRLFIGTKSSIKSSRFLRSHDTPKQNNNIGNNNKIEEERARVPGMTKLDEIATKLALQVKVHPMDFFKRIHAVKFGGKLDGDKEFLIWLLYVQQYRNKLGGDFWFSDDVLFDVLRKSKSEVELVALFQSLRQYPDFKYIADTMPMIMILNSASSHTLVNAAWLNSRETPEEVFKILRLKDEALGSLNMSPLFIQWLRYTKAYSVVVDDSFTDVQTLNFLLKAMPSYSTLTFGPLIHSIKNIPDLEQLAKNLQTHLYRKWMINYKITPKRMVDDFSGLAATIMSGKLPKTDPRYRNMEAYTIYYSEHRGGSDLLGKVKTLFANSNPYAAIVAASKALSAELTVLLG